MMRSQVFTGEVFFVVSLTLVRGISYRFGIELAFMTLVAALAAPVRRSEDTETSPSTNRVFLFITLTA
jgi:hypothetical protein